jgi:hypothetical protein
MNHVFDAATKEKHEHDVNVLDIKKKQLEAYVKLDLIKAECGKSMTRILADCPCDLVEFGERESGINSLTRMIKTCVEARKYIPKTSFIRMYRRERTNCNTEVIKAAHFRVRTDIDMKRARIVEKME